MKIYECSTFLDNSEHPHSSYHSNRIEAIRDARQVLSENAGEAIVAELKLRKPSDVGGAKKWGLLLLNDDGYVHERRAVARFVSIETERHFTSVFKISKMPL